MTWPDAYPTREQMPSDGPVLLGDLAGGASDADLSGSKWIYHPDVDSVLSPAQARDTWFAAFNFCNCYPCNAHALGHQLHSNSPALSCVTNVTTEFLQDLFNTK